MASTEPQINHAVTESSLESERKRTEKRLEHVRARQRREQEKYEEAKKTATDPSLTFAEKIDRVAQIRPWARGSDKDTSSIIDKYLTGSLSVDAAVEKLAAPIDHLYTTAEEGRAYYSAELVARGQRQYHPPEKALEQWGAEQEFPEPLKLPDGESYPSCERKLWTLYYTFLHAAKRIDWNHTDQARLMELMKALKARPDPPLPEPMTIPLRQDWIWENGYVWSRLLLLGPAAVESWNNRPAPGSKWTDIEVEAFVNFNAFIARITVAELSDFRLYATWAIRTPLELEPTDQACHEHPLSRTQMELGIGETFVWIKLAGQYLWDQRVENGPGYEDVTLTMRGEELPWIDDRRNDISDARWKFWMNRLLELSDDDDWSRTIRDKCLETARMMQEIAESEP